MPIPVISIITCVRNQAKYLPELLKSIEVQTDLSFEHILVDGESTDGTVELLNSYKEKNKNRFKIQLFSRAPQGIADAMNFGIMRASGKWIIVIHGDDYLWSENSVALMHSAIKEHSDSAWIIGNTVRNIGPLVFETRMHSIRDFLIWLVRYANYLSHQNTLIRKSVFDKHGLFLSTIAVSMDREFYLRLLSRGIRPTSVDKGFVVFRRHIGSTSLNPLNLFSEKPETRRLYSKYRQILRNAEKFSDKK